MRLSQYLLPTLRETPADAEIVSHQLMLRAGMIRRLAAGLYSWLPLGYRVVQRVEQVVREEMNAAGAQEVLMPVVQPAELWEESGRWDNFGPELLRIKDRHDRDFALGPTHEEVITDLIRGEVRSYRQLPLNLYQIQTKFRDEIRPRFGVMRAREFVMKDGYSFEADEASLDRTYEAMFEAYGRIFSRLGLDFRPVRARTGAIGGSVSHEFHVLAESGEDEIASCPSCGYAANVELAEAAAPETERPAPGEELRTVDTPGAYTIAAVSAMLDVPADRTVKTLFAEGRHGPVALVLRGDHELNEDKAAAHPALGGECHFLDGHRVKQLAGAEPGSVGPVGLDVEKVTVVADREAAVLADFVCGANRDDQHLMGVNWNENLPEPQAADLRMVVKGDPCPECRTPMDTTRGIEVGHIFKLGAKYSESLGATYLDADGREHPMLMGCYGIGVSRIVAAAIEQNHDDAGIRWPEAIAPFDVALIAINKKKSQRVADAAEAVYAELREAGYEVLYDDRDERPGIQFNDADLIGIPHRLVVGDKGLDRGVYEYKARTAAESEDAPADGLLEFLRTRAGDV
ncbi:proline--tRNA ligase [Thiohalorhabdus denitrificans]|uniref:Proline--tRNA ligase n=1 Tax=Thiohalorhabdus denitrificans TaxID=381306 RepID=A0A0P9EP76_9GAMM|nr:proline--tRNA ligase [Thiohalorhabdus denitrificans]KPV40273.1 proline--tRNA ligase [Thiohalorhabdus denitrificans]SCX81751.1 prolyl-tRNA synthetase [Thiohalorhabdus denitrificans]